MGPGGSVGPQEGGEVPKEGGDLRVGAAPQLLPENRSQHHVHQKAQVTAKPHWADWGAGGKYLETTWAPQGPQVQNIQDY